MIPLDAERSVTALGNALAGWTVGRPEEHDVPELTALVRRHQVLGRGWAGAREDEVLVEISNAPSQARHNLVLCDPAGVVQAWATAHDRVSGRMVFSVVVDPRLDDGVADLVADVLLAWGDRVAQSVGAERSLSEQQIDCGAFADDERQQRWLTRAGYSKVRTWWQMKRPIRSEDCGVPPARDGVNIRLVERSGSSGMPDEDDLRAVHDILEEAFADHFNSHEETFVEFLTRLREDPGHRWDHWWLAELVDGPAPEPVGTLVGTVDETGAEDGEPVSSYVAYIGVLESARGRGVAKSLLNTIIADAAERGRAAVGLEVDADSPTGAHGLYLSMGWETKYVTQSWHRDVPVATRG